MKKIFASFKAWVIANKVLSIIIAASAAVVLTLAIVLPITLSKHDHVYGNPSYEWNEDNTKCTARRICEKKSSHIEEETVNTTYSVETSATCEIDGAGKYVATFENAAFADQTKNVTISATGHDYGTPSYTWNLDHTECTATRVCSHNAEHVESETVSSTYDITTSPTYEATGVGTYTATFTKTAFEVQTYEEAVAKLDDLIFTSYNAGTEYKVKMRGDAVVDTIRIPNTYNDLPVTMIEDYGFTGIGYNVKKVIIPSSVGSVGAHTFVNNTHIEEIDGVIVMNKNTFEGCTSLKKLVFADTFTTVNSTDEYVYSLCPVEEAIYPGATTVNRFAFSDSKMKRVTFGKYLTTVQASAFREADDLEEIIVDEECTKFESIDGVLYQKSGSGLTKTLNAFPAKKNVASYEVADTTIKIEGNAFFNSEYVKEVTLPTSLTRLETESFLRATSIEKITITSTTFASNGVGERIFCECASLKDVEFPSGAPYICENGLLMKSDKSYVHFILGGYDQAITIPKEVTTINIWGGTRLISCPSFDVETGNTAYSADDGILFNYDKTTLVRFPYRGDENVDCYDFPDTVTALGIYSFACLDAEKADFEARTACVSIGNFAFYGSAFTEIKLHGSITSVGARPFDGCDNLTLISIKMDRADFASVTHTYEWRSGAPTTCNVKFNDQTVNITSVD